MEKLISVKNLYIKVKNKTNDLTIVEDISFDLEKGGIIGIVGESGCGKTMTALALAGLLKKNISLKGDIFFEDKKISDYSEKEFMRFRKNNVSMIFQDSAASLNPLMKIGFQVQEALSGFKKNTKQQNFEYVIDLLKKVRLNDPELSFYKYPHELSGGQRQRIMIAMAIAGNPKLLIADEITTALDVTTQLQILNLLKELRDKMGMGIIMISHDVSVVKYLCENVCVMYSGNIVEYGTVARVFENPEHPYTVSLLKSIPKGVDKNENLFNIKGVVPSLEERKKITGCIFYGRCEISSDLCCSEKPMAEHFNHYVMCHKRGVYK